MNTRSMSPERECSAVMLCFIPTALVSGDVYLTDAEFLGEPAEQNFLRNVTS